MLPEWPKPIFVTCPCFEFQVRSGVHLLGLFVIGFCLLFFVWSPALITICFTFM